tara:strand:+ start:15815 stop:16810 length:996 start_codon:yes stop_codon:yes gene_type:complete
MSSGMTLRQALSAIKDGVKNKRMKNIISILQEDVEEGDKLSEGLARTGLFSSYVLSLVRIGEESGRLSDNLEVVALNEQKTREFKSKIKSAMMYPVFVFGVTLVVGIGIAWFILPRLTVVFSQLNVELPAVTRALIRVGEFIAEYGNIVMPLAIALIILIFYTLFFFPKTRFIGEWILYHIPGIKELLKEVELARFGYLFGTLLRAGLPVGQALESVTDSTTSLRHRKLYKNLQDEVLEGNSFYKSIIKRKKNKKLIPSTVAQMINAGEQSGKLPETFLRIGEYYEGRTEIQTKNLTTILEPVLLVIVWLGVVGVAVAVILPIYGLLSGLQ